MIPGNILIIDIMNSTDRSIALVDYALRRRFYFIELMPDVNILTLFLSRSKNDPKNIDRVKQFFEFINKEIENDENLGRHFQLGHAYFMKNNMDCNTLRRIWRFSIKPILDEYYYRNRDMTNKFTDVLGELCNEKD
jgi:5-methylcytosine-specific restriction protein B